MDRRTFLKALASTGVALNLPAALATANDAVIDEAWRAASDIWGLFEVGADGALSYASWTRPSTRREAYQLDAGDLLDDIDRHPDAYTALEGLYGDVLHDKHAKALSAGDLTQGDIANMAEDGCLDWLQGADGPELDRIYDELQRWLDQEPEWCSEWEDSYTVSNPQGAAYAYFNAEDIDVLEALGIQVIEGDHPGSNYYAAELRVPIAEANRVAASRGWTIRFIEEGAVE